MNPRDSDLELMQAFPDRRIRDYNTEIVRNSDAVIREGLLLRIVKEYAERGWHATLIKMAENETYTVKLKEAAAKAAIEGYVANGWYKALITKIATNKKIPWRAREAAGVRAVEAYAMKGWYNTLADIVKNTGVTAHVRELAECHLELRMTQLEENGYVVRGELIKKHREAITTGAFSKKERRRKSMAPRKLTR